MEFEHVGLHCASCRRRDFLPLRCDKCCRHFCQLCMKEPEHVSLCQKRDMTSFDCPVCGKSVKYDKAENADDVWSVHFATECSQSRGPAEGSTKTAACAYSQCRKQLGPSNRFACPRCRKEVCLSHRMPEAHDCSALSRRPAAQPRPTTAAQSRSSAQKKPTGTSSSTPVEVH